MPDRLRLVSSREEPPEPLPEPDDRVDDAQLMVRVAQGDADALDTLLSRYWEPLLRFCRGYGLSLDDAEDVAQMTFVRVWEHRAGWRLTGSVTSYLYSISRNLTLNWKRRRATHEERTATLRRREERRRTPTPLEETEAGELRDAVESAIRALSERREEVFRLSRFEGLSYTEISAVLGISPQTVANHMSKALSELRDSLGPLLEDAE